MTHMSRLITRASRRVLWEVTASLLAKLVLLSKKKKTLKCVKTVLGKERPKGPKVFECTADRHS